MYASHATFFQRRGLSFEDFSMDSQSMMEYVASGSDMRFTDFKKTVEAGWAFASTSTNTTTVTPDMVDNKLFKSLSSLPVSKVTVSGVEVEAWVSGSIYVLKPTPEQENAFESIKELRIALNDRNVVDMQRLLPIVEAVYSDGQLIRDVKNRLSLLSTKTISKSISAPKRVKKTTEVKVEVEEDPTQDLFDLGTVGLTTNYPRGSYVGNLQTQWYIQVTCEGRNRKISVGPFGDNQMRSVSRSVPQGHLLVQFPSK